MLQVPGLEIGVEDLKFRIHADGLWYTVEGLGVKVQVLGFTDVGAGLMVKGLRI